MDFESIEGLSDEEIIDLYEGTNKTGDFISGCTLNTEFSCRTRLAPATPDSSNRCYLKFVTRHDITSSSTCKSDMQTNQKNWHSCYLNRDRITDVTLSCRYGFDNGTPTTVYYTDPTYNKQDTETHFAWYSRCYEYSSTYREKFTLDFFGGDFWVYKWWYCTD